MNGNGVWDQPDEPGLEGWTIFLDDNANGELDDGETWTTTGPDGSYAFLDLPPATYTVVEVMQEGWEQTCPGESETTGLIVNGGFETGDFSGWTVNTPVDPFAPWSVSLAGASAGGGIATSPPEGIYDAWNGFDGGGPIEFTMYQDVNIPVATTATLRWEDRAQWTVDGQPRTLEVQVRDPDTNAILGTVYSFSTTGTSGDTGWQSHIVDLSSYAGSDVRIYFVEDIPEDHTGPGQIEFDAISLTVVSSEGSHSVTLGSGEIVTNINFGNQEATTEPPTADAGGPYTVEENGTITLDASGSTDPDNDIVSYEWDLDNDGQFDDDNGVTVDYIANAFGVFTVSVRVTDNEGSSDEDSALVTVLIANPFPGDANRDGTVNNADSAIVSANWLMQTGATWADGDFNNDGRVNDIDATLMAANWQRTVIPPATSASAAVESEPEAVSYDLDNDGRVGLGDLAVFASVYRQQPGVTSDSSYAYAADFDGSGTVDLGDLALFAANYRLDRPDDPIVSSTAPQTAFTMAAEPAIMPGDANFDDDGRVSDDVAILARHWMMTVEDLDKEDNARRAVFADSGASNDFLWLIDE